MIELGDKVSDKVSGLVGIVTEKREFLNGCIQYVVSPKMKVGDKELPAWSIDEGQLTVISKKTIKSKKRDNGGPTMKVK